MNTFNLKNVNKGLKTNAEWYGLREVFESTNTHIARDGNPEANYTSSPHGVMVEVLVNGQFGYSGTNELTQSGIQTAMDNAVNLAENASKYSLVNFKPNMRPTNIGKYQSNAKNEIADISIPELNKLLISSEKY